MYVHIYLFQAKAVAHESQAKFFNISASSLTSKWVNLGANVHKSSEGSSYITNPKPTCVGEIIPVPALFVEPLSCLALRKLFCPIRTLIYLSFSTTIIYRLVMGRDWSRLCLHWPENCNHPSYSWVSLSV